MSRQFTDVLAIASLDARFTCRLRLDVPGEAGEPLEISWPMERFREWGFTSSRRDGGPSLNALAAFANGIWGQEPTAVRSWFRHVDTTGSGPLRILFSTESGALRDVPWEWLGGELARRVFGGSANPVPIVRVARHEAVVPPLRVSLPLRVLHVLPNPKARYHMETSQEFSAVAAESVAVVRRRLTAESLAALKTEAAEWQPQVIHFVGHGGCEGEEGHLVFSSDYKPAWANARQLAAVLPPSVRLLCLSSPWTTENYDIRGFARFALDSAARGLPSIVFAALPLTRESLVRSFWAAFYKALAQGNGLMHPYFAGRRALREHPDGSLAWPAFALGLRESSDQPFRIGDSWDTNTPVPAALAAQLAARLANTVATQNAALGESAPAILRQHAALQVRAASDIAATERSGRESLQ